MIASLRGKILFKNPPYVILEVNGVGYEIQLTMNAFEMIPSVGEEVFVVTYLQIREDAHVLYGFKNQIEKNDFLQIVKVSGIGAKTAMSILSVLDHHSLNQAISHNDSKALCNVPGIGKKTAERILLELKDKIGTDIVDEQTGEVKESTHSEIIAALVTLNYKEKDAFNVVKTFPRDIPVIDGIKQAVQILSCRVIGG